MQSVVIMVASLMENKDHYDNRCVKLNKPIIVQPNSSYSDLI